MEAGKIVFLLYLVNSDGSNDTLISLSGYYPRWSPDGSKIAFVSSMPWVQENKIAIVKVGAETVNSPIYLEEGGTQPDWSPLGDQLVFVSEEDDRILVVATGDMSVTDLGVSGRHPAWSPDGAKIAFVGKNPSGVYIVNPEGLELQAHYIVSIFLRKSSVFLFDNANRGGF